LANNLKLFAQFAHLHGYFFKAQVAKTQILLCKCASQIAQPWKNKP